MRALSVLIFAIAVVCVVGVGIHFGHGSATPNPCIVEYTIDGQNVCIRDESPR